MKGNLCLINPYNEKHQRLITEFETENGINLNRESYNNSPKLSNEEYERQLKQANAYELDLVLIDQERIKDSCHLQIEKDIKTCHLTFPPLKTKIRNREIVKEATDYAIEILGMQEVFVKLSNYDKSLLFALENQDFENLGSDGGETIFLKEQEQVIENKYHI